jgi:hypothetical protein
MTENIEAEIEAIRQFKKPYRDLSYDQICEMVNLEISKLGEDCTGADLREIDKKLGLPRGTSFEMGGFSDYLAFEETGGV